ncbi:MAG: DUF3164 family protein [SAR324 cluster bacterium]|nr:DUF3164 family protein [SAR324 cluster bacterium]
MAIEKTIEKEIFWEDSRQRLIPKTQVKITDQSRDEMIEQLVARWKSCQTQIKELKIWIYSEVNAFLDLLHQEYTANDKQKNNNVTLKDYSGRYKLVLNAADFITFDEKLKVAKSLIDSCIGRWSLGADKNLVAIINDAFRVNQQGRISIPRVLGLRNLNIEDAEWQQAMQTINDSIVIEHTKKYIRLYERDQGEEGKFVALPLDIANL